MVHWGNPTWRFFHSYAQHTSNHRFQQQRTAFIEIFSKTLLCLPCPLCRDHAQEYVKRNPLRTIITIDDLKLYIWRFHNNVNARLSKPEFSFETLSIYNNIHPRRAFGGFIGAIRNGSSLSISNSFIYNIVYRGWISLI